MFGARIGVASRMIRLHVYSSVVGNEEWRRVMLDIVDWELGGHAVLERPASARLMMISCFVSAPIYL